MSTEAQQPISQAADPAVPVPDAATTTTTGTGPITETRNESSGLGPAEAKPSDKGTAEAVPNLTNAPKEKEVGKGEVAVESHPINEGVLNLKSPGIKGLIPSKKYFWFSDAPLEEKNLAAYVSNEKSKDIAHGNASHATQTGKGLLFYAKRAEDKDHPQGIFNLADLSDVAKGNFNDFNATVNGSKYTFQAVTRAERDGWIVAIETKIAEAKSSREGIVGGEGYKSQLEKYAKPAAVAPVPSKTRSISRSKKDKESKSRERKAVTGSSKEAKATKTEAPKDSKLDTPKETVAATTTDPAADTPVVIEPTDFQKKSADHHGAEAVPAVAVAGGATAAATTRKESSEDDKKDKKSRSQSRGNKRSSIFGSLLAKKEETDDKKAAKKAEKEEKKEGKKEDKAAKQEDKHVVAATKSGEKKEEKAAKKEEKKEEKVKKEEDAAAAAAKKEHEKAKAEETVAALAAEAEQEKAKDEQKDAEKLQKKAEKEADKADKHEARAEQLVAEAAEKKESAAIASSNAATPTSTTKEKPNKRASVFGSLFGKKESATSPTEKAITKDETSAVSDTAPQLESPVPATTTETPVAATEDKAEVKPSTESPAATSATTPTDRRRTSFFSNLGTKKEKRADATSGDELTDGEKKKQSGGIGGLLRKASRAAPKKDKEAKTDGTAVPLTEDTAVAEKSTKEETPVTNGEPAVGKAAEATPAVAEDAPVAAVGAPAENSVVEAKA